MASINLNIKDKLRTKFILLCFFVLCLHITPWTFAQNSYTVYFDVDKYELKKENLNLLRNFYKKTFTGTEVITLTGHTDSDASNSYNLTLSKNRVNRVASILQELGHSNELLKSNYSGETEPLNGNASAIEKSKNRRVELTWESPTKTPVTETESGNIQDLYAQLEIEKQNHCINPNRDTLLRLEKGTIILIPANAFKTDGKNCVTFTAKEVFTLGEMLCENVSTMSNQLLLETGGMVYTEAADSKGNKVGLNPGKELTIMIPTDTLQPDMQLFYGERDPHTNQLNWNATDFGLESLYGFRLSNCYDTGSTQECDYCPYLFCRVIGRIDESIAGMRDSVIKQENKMFRKCQKEWRQRKRNRRYRSIDWGFGFYQNCKTMMEAYGVKDYDALMDTLNSIRDEQLRPEYDKYGVDNYSAYVDTVQKINAERIAIQMEQLGVTTQAEYQDTIRKIKELKQRQEYENAIDNLDKEIILRDLTYYVAEVNQMGWLNIDKFYDLEKKEKCALKTNLKENSSTDCKLIFRNMKSIMTMENPDGKYTFEPIPKGEPVTIFAIKFLAGKPYIHFQDLVTCNTPVKVNFKQVTPEKLKEILLNMEF